MAPFPGSGGSTSPTRPGSPSRRCAPRGSIATIRPSRARPLGDKQKPDGGWGEHYSGCLTGTYVEHAQSQPVMTSWALLALMEILGPSEPVRRGISWLCQSQRVDG